MTKQGEKGLKVKQTQDKVLIFKTNTWQRRLKIYENNIKPKIRDGHSDKVSYRL